MMKENLYEARPIIHCYKCELCNNGEQSVKLNAKGNPDYDIEMNLYVHQCDSCQGTMKLPKIYPYVDYKKGEMIKDETA